MTARELQLRQYRLPFADLYMRAWNLETSIGSVADSPAGLIALSAWHSAAGKIPAHAQSYEIVGEFLALPATQKALTVAVAVQKQYRATAAKNRNARALRDRRERYERDVQVEHNLQRGLSA